MELQPYRQQVLLVVLTVGMAALLNYTIIHDTAFLNIYNVLVVGAAYLLGKRMATLSAVLSLLAVTLFNIVRPEFFAGSVQEVVYRMAAVAAWGAFLIITAVLTGILFERRAEAIRELRATYHGILEIISTFLSTDPYTEHHSYRVCLYALKLGKHLGLTDKQLEDLRAAAIIHDVGKLKVSREVLYKASQLTAEEYVELKSHLTKGFEVLRPVSGSLQHVINVVLAHHDKFDGTGYRKLRGEEIPIESRVLSVADVYDALTSDRPYRKAMSPLEARELIHHASGKDFDPNVVDAFEHAFRLGDMEIPEVAILGDPLTFKEARNAAIV